MLNTGETSLLMLLAGQHQFVAERRRVGVKDMRRGASWGFAFRLREVFRVDSRGR